MKINWGFGPPKADPDAGSDEGAGRTSSGKRSGGRSEPAAGTTSGHGSEQHAWTSGANLATRAVVGLLWVALIAGPLALGLQLLTSQRAPVAQQSGSDDRLGEAAAVSEFAERAVVAWLETPAQESDSLTEYFGDLAQSRPEFPWTTDRPAVAEIVKDDSGLWSVVVAVDTTEGRPEGKGERPEGGAGAPAEPASSDAEADLPADDESSDDAEPVERVTSGRLYFQLPVLYVDGEMVAQALPAPVPAPEASRQLKSAYNEVLPAEHPAFARVANFLNAMLVSGDQAELEAYSSPGTSFRALDPVPYAAAEVRSILVADSVEPSESPQDGERIEIQADVDLYGSNEERIGAQYALVLRAREDRWEVAEVKTSPVLAEPVPIPTPTPTVTPTATADESGGGATGTPGTQEPPPDQDPSTTQTP